MITGNSLFLGTLRDAESNGQSSTNADGDDTNNTDDEDGVSIGNLVIGSMVNATVTANVPSSATFNGWIDFNDDGDWDDAGEHVFVDEAISNGVNAGLSIAVPSGLTASSVTARFRLTETPGYSYSGLAPNGEVEDQLLNITASRGIAAPGNGRQWALISTPRPNTSPMIVNQNNVPAHYSRFGRMTAQPAERFVPRGFGTFKVYSSASHVGPVFRSPSMNMTSLSPAVMPAFTGDILSRSPSWWSFR